MWRWKSWCSPWKWSSRNKAVPVSITLSDARIRLQAEPVRRVEPALPVAMLGHCPGRANWRWLLEQAEMVSLIEAAGYRDTLDHLRQLRDAPGELEDVDIAALTRLYRLPLPLTAFSQFQMLFPQAFSTASRYSSRLAGNAAWLPLAVRDFFSGMGAREPQRLWVLPVREADNQQAFLPHPDTDWMNGQLVGAFDRALGLPDVGLIALPDLERLQIPADLPDNPRLRLPNPAPQFLPCGDEYDDTHRERRNPDEMPLNLPQLAFSELIEQLGGELALRRPDIHLLLSMPFDEQPQGESPGISNATLGWLKQYRKDVHRHYLRRIQLLYPYLRSATVALSSPSGVIAAEMARRTRAGAWLSCAARPLSDTYRPYPPVNRQQATGLREEHALGVLIEERGQLKLDDERLAAGVFDDPAEHARSGEIARFLGWLQRELRRLGESLVFDVDPQDPRPGILLETFFSQLHARGALRGSLPEEAFSITQSAPAESTLLFEIDLAPAFPIDRIRVSISREGRDQGWSIREAVA